jgi:hypothetical protein
MAEFVFTLNSTQVLEPIGWDKAAIKIVRDGDMPGLFTQVIADLQFYGNGYSLLKNLYDTTDGCMEVPVSITNNCDFTFEGIIYLSDVSFDTKKCIASCSIEDNSGAGLIARLKGTTVQVNGGKTLDGTALADIGDTLTMGGVIGNKLWFKAIDVMQYCLDYISNGDIEIVSTFLTTNYTPRRKQVTVTALGPSGLFSPDWTDIYGQPQGTNGLISGALTNVQLATRMAQILNGQGLIFDGGVNESNGIWPIYADNNGTDTIEIIFFGNQDITFGGTFPWASLSISDIETPSYGAGNVYLTTGSILRNEIEAFFMSFQRVFNSLAVWYNLSIQPYESGGQKYVRIEQEPYFFEDVQTAQVDNFDAITQQKQDQYAFSSLNYNQSSRDLNAFLHQQISYVGQSCSANDISAQSDFNVPTGTLPADPMEVSAKDVLIAERWDPSGIPAVRAYPVSYFDGVSIQSGFYYAASVVHPLVAKNFSNRAPSGMTLQGITVANNNNPVIKSIVSFQATTTPTQRDDILANPKGYILHDGVKGWISEINFEIKTGFTTFELYTE